MIKRIVTVNYVHNFIITEEWDTPETHKFFTILSPDPPEDIDGDDVSDIAQILTLFNELTLSGS